VVTRTRSGGEEEPTGPPPSSSLLAIRALFLGGILVMQGCSSDRLPHEASNPSGGAHCVADPLPDAGSGSGCTEADALSAPASSWPAEPRVVVIGDLHSDIQATRQAFQLAGGTDEDDTWIGDALTIAQLGDMIGRSDDERQVLDFLFDVREQAQAAGGKVHLLVGNHEVMGARVDNQAVGLNPFPGYEDLTDLDLGDPRLQILAEHAKKRGAALMSGGPMPSDSRSSLPYFSSAGRVWTTDGSLLRQPRPRQRRSGVTDVSRSEAAGRSAEARAA
jgi:hypothetical protein